MLWVSFPKLLTKQHNYSSNCSLQKSKTHPWFLSFTYAHSALAKPVYLLFRGSLRSSPLASTASTSCLNHSHRLLTSLSPPLSLPGSLAFSCSLTTPSSFLLQNLGPCCAPGLECSDSQIVSWLALTLSRFRIRCLLPVIPGSP